MRVALANGMKGIPELSATYGIHFSGLCSLSDNKLNQLFRGEISGTECRQAGMQHGGGYARRLGWAKETRVCPYCVQEEVPQFVMFNFAIPVLCPRHGELPIDVCPSCSARPSYLRARINYCGCGFYFGAAKGHSRPPWLGKFYERFACWHYCLPKTFPELSRVAKADWVAAQDVLSRLNGGKKVRSGVFVSVSDFAAIKLLLSKRGPRRKRG